MRKSPRPSSPQVHIPYIHTTWQGSRLLQCGGMIWLNAVWWSMSFWLQCCVVDGPEILAQTSELSGEQSFWVVCRQRKHRQEASAKILNTLEWTFCARMEWTSTRLLNALEWTSRGVELTSTRLLKCKHSKEYFEFC